MTESFWQDQLGNARTALVAEGNHGNPSPSESMQAILNTGNALANQLDQDQRAKTTSGIPAKLRVIELEKLNKPLFDKYEDLNRFFNVTKHIETRGNENNRARLEGSEGWFIAMDYFECVRRIFVWYYEQKGAIPSWRELDQIDRAGLSLKFTFDLSKRWQ